MIIDTHIHIWDLKRAAYDWLKEDTSILNRTYRLEELLPSFPAAKVTQGVLVQAANHMEDTELMLETARNHDQVAGVVGWLPLMDPVKTFGILNEKLLKEKYFKGVRHLIHNEPDPAWLLQSEVLESLQILAMHNIPYDVVGVNNDHLETAIKVSEKIPDLTMVLDHLNQPPIAEKKKFGKWGELMKTIAANSNVYAKISGLGTASGNFTGWTADDIKPYIAYTLEFFGTQRCFCGGDWPVSLLAGTYEMHWMIYQDILSSLLPKDNADRVLYKNARAFYNL
ncbi:amidohydrolase family protein [Agriterribacter sp.]|uniref:amidohydrolase family protein n=1 Tax=Agriterribacter sp. TaxID=2821509 RepID=UPI002B622C63|nr:amidohydrolase family protein [Agriterribacter sp.]HTN08823.1 amidohydrolase family protein [Agriterribacter sp.]